jgi:hypothetical protein
MWADGGPYEQWSTTLRRWGAGEQIDVHGLPALSPEDFTTDQWVRVTQLVSAAIDERLKSWAAALTRAIAEARDEFSAARELTHARDGLRVVRAVAAHRGLPPDLSKGFVEAVDTQIRNAQQMLEQQLDDMRRAGLAPAVVEARRRTLRDNPLTAVTQPADAMRTAAADPWLSQPTSARRRVIP